MPTIDQLRELEELLAEATEPDIELMIKAGELFEIGDFHSYWLWIGNRAYTEAALALVDAVDFRCDSIVDWGPFKVSGRYSVHVERPPQITSDSRPLAILRAIVAAMIQQQETKDVYVS